MENVEEFVKDKGLEDKLGLFQKAAILAQNPKDFEQIPGMTEEDKEVIRRETTRMCLNMKPHNSTDIYYFIKDRWSQSRELYFTVVVCSLAAAVQCVLRNYRHSHLDTHLLISYRGWDQTGSNGANLSFPQALGIDNTPGSPNAQRNDWIVGLINSGYVLIRRSCRHRR